MLIKKLEIRDLKDIFELEKICFPDSFWSFEQIQAHLKNQEGIAAKGEITLGYLLYLENSLEIEILRVGVLPFSRRTGCGEKMIHNLLSLNKEIFLDVSSGNVPALKLYEKCGFEVIHKRKQYYGDGSDALILKNCSIRK